MATIMSSLAKRIYFFRRVVYSREKLVRILIPKRILDLSFILSISNPVYPSDVTDLLTGLYNFI